VYGILRLYVYAYTLTRTRFLSGQIFTRCASAFIRPVIPRPRASTAYNRINAVIRTSLQCNSLALQSSKVFTPSCLCLFHFRNIIFTGAGSAMKLLAENLHSTLRCATRFTLQENYCDTALCLGIDHFDRRPLNCVLRIRRAFYSRFCAFVRTRQIAKYPTIASRAIETKLFHRLNYFFRNLSRE